MDWNSRGISVYNKSTKNFRRYRNDPADHRSLSDNRITKVFADHDGRIWIATWGGGVNRYDPESDCFVRYKPHPDDPTSLCDSVVLSIAQEDNGTIWIGTSKGLNLLQPGHDKFIQIRQDNERPRWLGNDNIRTIFVDKAGIVWLGTLRLGVHFYDRKRAKFHHVFKLPSESTGLSNNEVWSIMEDSKGAVWISTSNGLNKWDRGTNTFQHYFHNLRDPASLTTNETRAILEDHEGQLWVGSTDGLHRFNPVTQRFIRYQHRPDDSTSLSGNVISCLAIDRNRQLWVGIRGGGVNRFDFATGRFMHLKGPPGTPPSFASANTRQVYEDKPGIIWIATEGQGIFRYDPRTNALKQFLHVPLDSSSVGSNEVESFHEDAMGNFWVGTGGGGLDLFDWKTGKFKRYLVEDGLSNNVVYGILEDNNGCLWLSTNKGLSRFNTKNRTFRNYGPKDGVQSNEFTQNAFFRNKSGEMFFGGVNGFNVFHPDSIKDNPHIPPVVITSIKIFNEEAVLGQAHPTVQEIVLLYDQNFFSFEFAALDYTIPEKNQYAYILEGIDPDWVNVGTRRYAGYTHIEPGQYLFKVRASNNDGIWNNEATAINVTVLPPYWQTWWFRLLAVLGLVGTLALMYQYRVNKLLQVERTRNRIARDLHDEVSATLSGINYFAQAISDDAENRVSRGSQKFLSLIHESAMDVQESMSDIIWSINPENDDWNHVFAKLRRYASDLFDSKGIRYSINTPQLLPTKLLTMDRRRHFWLIYKEMVTNIVKHSACSEASVAIGLDPGKSLRLVISDNGKGFDQGKPSERNGNKNIRARTQALGATVHLDTAPGNGTRWELLVPL